MMTEKRKTSQRQDQQLGKIKFAIAAGAVTITLGFWTMYSNQADRKAAVVSPTPEPKVAVDPNSQFILLPIPTLVPQTSADVAANLPAPSPPAANSSSSTASSQFTQGQKILLGGPQPSQARPQTVTRSRSSR